MKNTDGMAEKDFFKAVFQERQQVINGKALRILLQEPIPALNLEAGSILKGVPYLSGNRILVKITAAVCQEAVRPVSLLCFDQEDLLEGLYHDTLSERLEEDAKEEILGEILNEEFKGARTIRKLSDFSKRKAVKNDRKLYPLVVQVLFDYVLLLYNDKESVRKEIADFLGMDNFDMEKYASLRRKDHYTDGYHEVFMKEMGRSSG